MLGSKSPRQRHPVVLTRDQWGPAGPLHSSWLDHGSTNLLINNSKYKTIIYLFLKSWEMRKVWRWYSIIQTMSGWPSLRACPSVFSVLHSQYFLDYSLRKLNKGDHDEKFINEWFDHMSRFVRRFLLASRQAARFAMDGRSPWAALSYITISSASAIAMAWSALCELVYSFSNNCLLVPFPPSARCGDWSVSLFRTNMLQMLRHMA